MASTHTTSGLALNAAGQPERNLDADAVMYKTIVDAVRTRAIPNDPDSVIKVMDEVGWNGNWHNISVGPAKGAILANLVKDNRPETVLELGAFVGYSTVFLAGAMVKEWEAAGSKGPRPTLVSVEFDPSRCAVVGEVLSAAGVADTVVKLVQGDSGEVIPALKEQFPQGFDMVFIDHWMELYLRDLKMLEELGLVRKGTIVIADNVLYPGAPDYLAHLKANKDRYETEILESTIPGIEAKDWVTVTKVVA